MAEASLVRWLVVWLNKQPRTVAWKVHGSPYQRAGMPDVLAFRHAGTLQADADGVDVFAFEVKSARGRLTRLQAHELLRLRAVGVIVAVVRSREQAVAVFEGVEAWDCEIEAMDNMTLAATAPRRGRRDKRA